MGRFKMKKRKKEHKKMLKLNRKRGRIKENEKKTMTKESIVENKKEKKWGKK